MRKGDASDAFSAWTDTEDTPYVRKIKAKEDPEIECFKNDDIADLMPERNYECLLDFDQEKKLDYWQEQRIREEEAIMSINFE